jgi:hypothetical protein
MVGISLYSSLSTKKPWELWKREGRWKVEAITVLVTGCGRGARINWSREWAEIETAWLVYVQIQGHITFPSELLIL